MQLPTVGAFLLLFLTSRAVAGATPPPKVTARAGPPTAATSFTPVRLQTLEYYRKELMRWDGAPPIQAVPESLSPAARFAVAFDIAGAKVAVAVDETLSGHTVTADLDGDGDLRNEIPRVMAPVRSIDPGSPGFGEMLGVEFARTGQALLKLEIAPAFPNGVMVHPSTEREGVLDLGNRSVRFVLYGFFGRYDEVSFDRNGDGRIERLSRLSDERFRAEERWVHIDGTAYEFEIGADGESVTLTQSMEPRVERARLDTGNPAPDFEFADLDGKAHRLSDYRGRVVLLHFWATWCGPCQAEAPYLFEAYSRFSRSDFEIIGVAKGDVVELVRAYGISWPQTVQTDDGPVIELYRVNGVPADLLIDRDGTIMDTQAYGSVLLSRVVNLLAGECPPLD